VLCTLQAPIGDIGIVYVQLGKLDAERLDESYANDGQTVSLTVSVQHAWSMHWSMPQVAEFNVTSGRYYNRVRIICTQQKMMGSADGN